MSPTPNRCTPSGRTIRLAARSSGASGETRCHQSISAAASSRGMLMWKHCVGGAGTVFSVRRVTTPNCPPPEPPSAHNRSSSARRFDHAAVREHHLRRGHLIARQPVSPPEHAEPTTERQARDPDGRAAPAGDRAPAAQRVVDRPEPRPGPDGRRVAVEASISWMGSMSIEHARRGRAAGEAMPTAPRRDLLAPCARLRDRVGDLRRRRAPRVTSGLCA